MNTVEHIKDFKNWTEVTTGLYRYMFALEGCYEIHVLFHTKNTDILTATASLYIVGNWINKEGGHTFVRECLLAQYPLIKCLEQAYLKELQSTMLERGGIAEENVEE